MNNIILSHKTALYVIRKLRSENNIKSILVFVEEIIHSRKNHGNQNLEILVNSHNKKHNNWRFNYHVLVNKLPHNSMLKLTDEISVVCPELLLIQLSRFFTYEDMHVNYF